MLKNIFGGLISLSALILIGIALYSTKNIDFLWGIPLVIFFIAYFPWQNE